MMFCRPSTAILLLARLKIFLFSLHTLTLKIVPFLPKFEFPSPAEPQKHPQFCYNFALVIFSCMCHFLSLVIEILKKVKYDTPEYEHIKMRMKNCTLFHEEVKR